MIQLSNLSKSYDGKTLAVEGLSLEAKGGEIIGFLGPNGAGKTTTIKMMTGILEPDQGTVTLNGYDIVKDGLEAKRQFAFVSDNPNLFLRLKGKEYLSYIADIYDVPKEVRVERIQQLAKDFGMEKALVDQIKNYSHGMRQKIVLMGALIRNPEIWILDEPMTGLDPQSAFLLKQRMRQHADQGKLVLFSTHVLEVAEKVCDRIAIIDKGKLRFFGALEELRSMKEGGSLEDIFLQLLDEKTEEA